MQEVQYQYIYDLGAYEPSCDVTVSKNLLVQLQRMRVMLITSLSPGRIYKKVVTDFLFPGPRALLPEL